LQRRTSRKSKHWPSWDTKKQIWKLRADHYSDDRILHYLAERPYKYPDAPNDRNTVSKIRKEFFKLERRDLVRAIKEAPTLNYLLSDEQILSLMAKAFCRSAFETPIEHERSIPDFIDAIEDTIKALNTGYLDARDGKPIEENLPTLDYLKDERTKATLRGIVKKLNSLSEMCTTSLKDGTIKQRGPAWITPRNVSAPMEKLRNEILDDFRRIYPNLNKECLLLQLEQQSVQGQYQNSERDKGGS
jgi:hypothetical protein